MKIDKRKEEETHAIVKPEFHVSTWEFLELLENMDEKKETMKNVSGVLEGPYGSKAKYGCTIRLGIKACDFPLRRGFNPRARPMPGKFNR